MTVASFSSAKRPSFHLDGADRVAEIAADAALGGGGGEQILLGDQLAHEGGSAVRSPPGRTRLEALIWCMAQTIAVEPQAWPRMAQSSATSSRLSPSPPKRPGTMTPMQPFRLQRVVGSARKARLRVDVAGMARGDFTCQRLHALSEARRGSIVLEASAMVPPCSSASSAIEPAIASIEAKVLRDQHLLGKLMLNVSSRRQHELIEANELSPASWRSAVSGEAVDDPRRRACARR